MNSGAMQTSMTFLAFVIAFFPDNRRRGLGLSFHKNKD
jgi:hypothetical protein